MKEYSKGVVTGIMGCLAIMMAVVLGLQVSGKADFSGVLAGNSAQVQEQRKIEAKAKTIKTYIDAYFLDSIDDTAMEDSIYKGIVAGLGDEYAAYYTADEYKEIKNKTSGTYYGIGAYVSQDADTDAITIVKPMKDSYAEKAGLLAGDVLYEVEGEKVAGKDLSEVLALIKGEEGSKVKIKVARSGEKDYLEFSVTRGKIEEETVLYEMLDDGIGYVQITGFEEVTPKQFSAALEQLQKDGMTKLLLDLRDNGGGLLQSAVDMLDTLLPKGLLVYTEDSKDEGEKYYAQDDDQVNLPMAVLVNGNSASASEVFSGALQDKKKAVLVGTKTFGKGIVQTIFDMGDGSALKMTTSKYFTPNGRNIHGTGLDPDIQVELKKDTLNRKDKNGKLLPDNQMEKAISYLKLAK